MRFAAIDIGTVTCRLLVADVDDQGIHEVYRGYGITNLGEGTASTGLLKPEAMHRVEKQVESFLETIERCRTTENPDIKVVAMATSASRDAKNAADFIALLDRLGIVPSVISGDREAALSFKGVSSDFRDEDLMVVDIGGGSTEVIVGHAGQEPLFRHSFNIGCRRVTEAFLASDPPAQSELDEARDWILKQMEPYFDRIRQSGFAVGRLVAVAGTATSVVTIHKQMKEYNSAEVHRSVIGRAVLGQVFDRLRSLTLADRRRVVGLDPDRASVIVAGLLILDVVMELSGQQSFTASESDILQGIILDAAGK